MNRRSLIAYAKRIIAGAVALIYLFPFIISVLLALKSKQETTESMLSLPKTFHWENFAEAMERANLLNSMRNSLIVTSISVLLVIMAASMAGYAIGRQYKSRIFRLYEMVLMATMMIPFQTLMIPLYKMFRTLGLLNTLVGVIILIVGTNIPFAVMMYIGFVRVLPIELEEAARLEGCSFFQVFVKIVFPLLKPVTVTIAVLDALWAWNEFNASLMILQKNDVKTIPIQQYVFFGEHSADYNMAFAAAVFSMIPIVMFFIIMQKHIIKGMTAGAVKG